MCLLCHVCLSLPHNERQTRTKQAQEQSNDEHKDTGKRTMPVRTQTYAYTEIKAEARKRTRECDLQTRECDLHP